MLCKRCMTVMEPGTEYYPKKDDSDNGYKRFHKCKRCHEKVYTRDLNFQECVSSSLSENRKI